MLKQEVHKVAKSAEKLKLKLLEVKRKTSSGDLVKDLKDGYVYFDVVVDGNGKKLTFEKRVRLDKPERMCNKFVTKIKAMAEEQYKEKTYYVAQNTPPAIESVLTNEEDANDKMLAVFEEVGQYMKTKKVGAMVTANVKF
jgi:hypothetical protein